jgi:hypothetical protein
LDFSTPKDEATMLCQRSGTNHSDVMPYPMETEIKAINPHYRLEPQGQHLLVTADPDPNNVIIADIQSNEFIPTITQ